MPPTLPAVTVTASRDDAATQTDKIDGGALGSRKQVDTPFSTHVVIERGGRGPDGADRQRPLQVRPGGREHQQQYDRRKRHVHRARHADRHAEQHQGGRPELPVVGHGPLARTVRASRSCSRACRGSCTASARRAASSTMCSSARPTIRTAASRSAISRRACSARRSMSAAASATTSASATA